jgi:hypothetical protein
MERESWSVTQSPGLIFATVEVAAYELRRIRRCLGKMIDEGIVVSSLPC